MAVYCFKCKERKGTYHRIMKQNLEFSTNWNNKLNCECFTTFRRHNPATHVKGAEFDIYLKGVFKGKAKLVDLRVVTLDKVNDFAALLDTGYLAKEFREIVQKMYQKHRIDWIRQKWDYCLLQYVEEKKELLFESHGESKENEKKKQPTLQVATKRGTV